MFVQMHEIMEGWQDQPSITVAVHLLITNMPKNVEQWQAKASRLKPADVCYQINRTCESKSVK
jgi:hypothetical protein